MGKSCNGAPTGHGGGNDGHDGGVDKQDGGNGEYGSDELGHDEQQRTRYGELRGRKAAHDSDEKEDERAERLVEHAGCGSGGRGWSAERLPENDYVEEGMEWACWTGTNFAGDEVDRASANGRAEQHSCQALDGMDDGCGRTAHDEGCESPSGEQLSLQLATEATVRATNGRTERS